MRWASSAPLVGVGSTECPNFEWDKAHLTSPAHPLKAFDCYSNQGEQIMHTTSLLPHLDLKTLTSSLQIRNFTGFFKDQSPISMILPICSTIVLGPKIRAIRGPP